MSRTALATLLLLAWPLAGQAQEPAASFDEAAKAPTLSGSRVPVAPDVGDVRGMRHLPAGSFVPAFAVRAPDGSVAPVRVEGFELDATPVTVAEYLAFLRAEPTWRRSAVPAVLGGERYLEAWEGDLEPGLESDELERPVTGVSWSPARAFCAARDARLPTTEEWEYAASLGGGPVDDARHASFVRTLRRLYARRPAPDELPPVGRTFRNGPGLWDLHGLVWEWTADFNGLMATGAGRDDQGLDRRLFCAAGSVDATDRTDYAAFARHSFRTGLTGDYAGRMLGFRCARSADQTTAGRRGGTTPAGPAEEHR